MKAWEEFIFQCLINALQSNNEETFKQVFELAQSNQEVARLLFQALLYDHSQRKDIIDVTNTDNRNIDRPPAQ